MFCSNIKMIVGIFPLYQNVWFFKHRPRSFVSVFRYQNQSQSLWLPSQLIKITEVEMIFALIFSQPTTLCWAPKMHKSLCCFCKGPVMSKRAPGFRCLLIGRIKVNAQETNHPKISVLREMNKVWRKGRRCYWLAETERKRVVKFLNLNSLETEALPKSRGNVGTC